MLHGRPKSHVFQTFFFKIFCQRGLASFVTPGVTDCAWSSKVTCCSNFFLKFFLSKGSCVFCYSQSNRCCMVIPDHMFFNLFFSTFFLSKGSCKFCYSWSNRLCMVIQSHMFFKLFFSQFFVKGVLRVLLLQE